MTILDDRPPSRLLPAQARPLPAQIRPLKAPAPPSRRSAATGRGPRPDRPSPVRPAGAARDYGRGIAVSRAVHPGRQAGPRVSTAATAGLAVAAALITLWLGSLAQVSGVRPEVPAGASGSLAVVRVQAGETLQQLAGRVAPGLPAGRVVAEIRDLNDLDSVAVQAGQTLIAPVG